MGEDQVDNAQVHHIKVREGQEHHQGLEEPNRGLDSMGPEGQGLHLRRRGRALHCRNHQQPAQPANWLDGYRSS